VCVREGGVKEGRDGVGGERRLAAAEDETEQKKAISERGSKTLDNNYLRTRPGAHKRYNVCMYIYIYIYVCVCVYIPFPSVFIYCDLYGTT